MRRRDLIALLGSAAAWPLAAAAQRGEAKLIGFLGLTSAEPNAANTAAFEQGLKEAGWTAGQNAAVEYRWAEAHEDRLPALAAELVGRKVAVIATSGGLAPAAAAKRASATIPIVFVGVDDPVKARLVSNFASPGGNITGISLVSDEIIPKRFELLTQLAPKAKTIALLVNPAIRYGTMGDIEDAAKTKGVQLATAKVGTGGDFAAAFAALAKQRAEALLVMDDPFFASRRDDIVALASQYKLPAMYGRREFAASGGLASYGGSVPAAYEHAGDYAGRILNGANPAELPVILATLFELVINKKTAATLGLTVPPALIQRADEVIE
jgi:putative ABC transport system substrate-binding protein